MSDKLPELEPVAELPSLGPTETAAPAGTSWLQAFGGSVLGSLGEFVGIQKSPQQQAWDAQHPWSARAADFTGYALPFAAWEKAAAKIAPLEKFVARLGSAETAPILTKSLQEVARVAPLEAGRIATAAALGDRPISDTLGDVALDLGTIGVLSGVGQGLQEYGKKRQKLSDLVPGATPDLPPQLQMRAAKEFLANQPELSADLVDTINNRLAEFSKITRLEEVTPGYRYVGPVDNSSGKDINRLFDVSKDTSGISRKLFMSGSRGFKGEFVDGVMTRTASDVMQEAWGKTGFQPLQDELPYMQFPRYVEAKKGNGAGFVQGAIQREMQNVGDNVWLTRERNNGLFVLAKKIEGGEKAAVGDKWVLFKTDNPGRFLPNGENWAQNVVDKAKWLAEPEKVVKATGSKIYDFAESLTNRFPMLNYIGASENVSKVAQSAEALATRMGLDKVSGAKQTFSEFFNRYFTPASFQFSKSPRANWVNGMARAVYDEGDRLAHEAMYGKSVLKDSNLWKASLAGTEFTGDASVKGLLQALDKKDLGDVWKAWNLQMSPEAVGQAFGRGEISQATKDFLEHMAKLDSDMIAQIQTTQAAYGQELFRPMENHYMISRTWTGNWRVPIQNEDGQLVYMAAGKTKRAAESLGESIVKETGKGWTTKPAVLADRATESPVSLAGYFNDMTMNRPDYFEAAKAAEKVFETRHPKFMEKRQGIGGFAAESAPWTKDELEKTIYTHLQQQNRYMSKLVVNERFGADRARLLAEDPAMFNVLEDRLNDLAGKQGPIAELTNKITDKVLAPVLGPNSASKIASITNQSFMHFQMGAMTLAQPIQNLLTFTQTVIPEIAFVLGAAPERLAPYYGVWPIAGAGGKVSTFAHVLDPLRFMRRSFAEMGKPSELLFRDFERAAQEGVISPRMVEEYIGQGALRAKDLRRAVESPGNFVGWMKAVSESLLSGTEKLSRGNAFTVGHLLGRDFLGLQDEQLYQFAKKFTQRTMYGYATADRARIFTTPVGSMLGLFKNWMMHFMGTMMQYTGEGVMYNNWAPLLWQTAGVSAVGGIAATGPMYFLADKFSQMANNKPLMDNTYELFGGVNPISDAVFFGLPTLLGTSLSGTVNSPFSNPTRDITQLFSFVQLDRLNAVAKAAGTAIDAAQATGHNPIDNELVRLQLARAFLPKTIYRSVAAWEDKTIRSLATGNPQLKGLTPAERVMYMTGLNPTIVDRQNRVADELWNDQEKMKDAVKGYGQAFYDAQKRGDSYTMHNIMLRSMADGIDFSRVLRSVNAHANKEDGDAIEQKFNPKNIWEKRQMLETR